MSEQYTEDRLLGGRIVLKQPARGFRVGIDSVFLAAAVNARAGEQVLDVGCGAGAAALCVAARVEGVAVTGLDIDRTMVRLASDNAEGNGLAARARFFAGDLKTPPIRLSFASFDHVISNPPFTPADEGQPPPEGGKELATVEGEVKLAEWITFCVRMVRPNGTVILIHRADRLDDLLVECAPRLGGITIFPLWPSADAGKAAKRVIVSGRKGSSAPLTLLPGMVLHRSDSRFTEAAEGILRHAHALPW